ncbi:anion permease, partial [Salmonella enterica subsp. enterica serovar Montevideo]|nr:anion permease [Salmonella enterica subsp. enterica serovar Montevideo]
IEMVHRYAHLAPNHLTEHAREIDDIFGDDVPNMSHMENKEEILVFYFAHYLFASLSAHTATMLPVILAVGKGIPGVPMEQLCIL